MTNLFNSMLLQPSLTPANFTGGMFWGDGSQTAAGAVASWFDRFGNGNAATQGTSAARPVCTANQQNGKSTLLFSAASSQTLILPSALYSVPNGANTTFIVAKRNTEDASTQVILNYGHGASTNRAAAYFTGTSGQVAFRNEGGSGTPVTLNGNTNTNYEIIVGTFNGTTGISLAVNNGTASTNSLGAVDTGIDRAHIGSRTDVDLYLSGGIGELIIYNRLFNATEILAIVRYLSRKWAITIS